MIKTSSCNAKRSRAAEAKYAPGTTWGIYRIVRLYRKKTEDDNGSRLLATVECTTCGAIYHDKRTSNLHRVKKCCDCNGTVGKAINTTGIPTDIHRMAFARPWK